MVTTKGRCGVRIWRRVLHQISIDAGYSPRLCLRRVDDEFPDAKALLVAVVKKDGSIAIRTSNITLGELSWIKTNLDSYMMKELE